MVRYTLSSALFLAFAGIASAADLQSMSYNVLAGDKIEVRLTMSEPVADARSFTTDNPPRISLDLSGVSPKLDQKSMQIGVGVARSVAVAEAQGRTRVVVNLDQMLPFTTRSDGNDFVIVLGDSSGAVTAATNNAAKPKPTTVAKAANNAISNIDFRRGEKGEARVTFALGSSKTGVDLRQEGRTVIADFLGTGINPELVRRLDVLDFGTPAKVVETSRRGSNVQTRIETNGEFEYLGYQTDNLYTLELKPLTQQEVETKKARQPVFAGERLTLTFQDIQVRAVLQIIAEFQNINMVTSDSVSGSITLRLQNVPWDQALDIILKTKGLDKRQNGNVMLVAPADEIAAREKLALENEKQREELEPLRSEFIQVNYAKASEIAALMKSKENSLLSERGNVTIDDRTNTLLVLDTARKIDDIRAMIRVLDIPVRQVLIESRIVTATDEFSRELGAKFGLSDKNSQSGFAGSLDGAVSMAGTGTAPTSQRLNFNNPVTSGGAGRIGFNISRLVDGTILDLELSALEAENNGEVIASPRVVTANQREAFIEDGVEIPYLQASSAGATNVSFKKAVLSLKVKPQITPDERIMMDLSVTQDTVGEIFAGVPSIKTQEVGTQLLVNNGETVVLGGVYKQITGTDVSKIPLLGDIPGLGWLFRNKIDRNEKQELLIFVTPKILKDNTTR